MHGYGAPGDDLVPLGRYLRAPSSVRFVFPEAPLALEGEACRAWWELDITLFERRARGERVDRSEEMPKTLPALREQVFAMLTDLEQKLQVSRDRIVLGGFSQGSMMACDVALHCEQKPAALVLLSSTLIARPIWAPRMATMQGVRVLQSHGRSDPLLPFEDAVRLADLLRAGGAELSLQEFAGGHEIPPSVLEALARLITELS
jgi:phospholipase/carboxylesterase